MPSPAGHGGPRGGPNCVVDCRYSKPNATSYLFFDPTKFDMDTVKGNVAKAALELLAELKISHVNTALIDIGRVEIAFNPMLHTGEDKKSAALKIRASILAAARRR